MACCVANLMVACAPVACRSAARTSWPRRPSSRSRQATRASVNGRCGTASAGCRRDCEQFAPAASGGGMTVEAPRSASWRSCGDSLFVLVVDTSLMNVSISAVSKDSDTTVSGVQSAIAARGARLGRVHPDRSKSAI